MRGAPSLWLWRLETSHLTQHEQSSFYLSFTLDGDPSSREILLFQYKCKNVSFSKPQSLASYSYVCGRAIGYGIGSPDAFVLHPTDIEQVYVDGIGLSHGHPRHHIWTFAAGHRQIYTYCDCGRPRPPAPAFVKSNYFCDGAANGALWDAKDCSNDCCKFNSPPFFNVNLHHFTSDDIEVRICINQAPSDEKVLLNYLELYVK